MTANSETGWSKEFPSHGSWFFLRHAPDAEPELHQLTGGRAWMESFGIVRDTTEFLGPITASDFDQLMRLRKQASLFDEVVRDLEMRTCYGCNNRIGWNETPTKYGDWTKCASCRNARALLKQVAALREALAPK